MAQSLSQIYLHVVFSTKNRAPFLRDRVLRDPWMTDELPSAEAFVHRAMGEDVNTAIVGGRVVTGRFPAGDGLHGRPVAVVGRGRSSQGDACNSRILREDLCCKKVQLRDAFPNGCKASAMMRCNTILL